MSVTSNIEELKADLKREFGDCVYDISTDMEEAIRNQIAGYNYLSHFHRRYKGYRDETIVDTGELHDSIQSAIELHIENEAWAIAGTNCSYAWETHEVGSYREIEPRPFITDALEGEETEKYKDAIKAAFENALLGFT